MSTLNRPYCGSVGRAVAFDIRGPRFHSSHRQNFIENLFIINCIEKTKINKKEADNGPLLKKDTKAVSALLVLGYAAHSCLTVGPIHLFISFLPKSFMVNLITSIRS